MNIKIKKTNIKCNKEIHIALLLIFLLVLNNFSKLKLVNFDQLAFDNYTFIGNIKRAYEFTIIGQARPGFVSIITTAIEFLNTDYYWIWAILYIFFISLIGAFIIFELTKSIAMTQLSFLLIVGFSVISLEPISMPSAYAFSLGFGIVAVLLAVYFTLKYNTTQRYQYKLIAVICILLASFNYEIGILYLPVLIGINSVYLKTFSIRQNWEKSKEFIFAGIFYVLVFLVIKYSFTGNYGGVKVNESFEPLTILYTYFMMLLANIPGFFFFYDSSNAYDSPIHEIYDYGSDVFSFSFLTNNFITLSFLIQLILFTYLLFKIYGVYQKEFTVKMNTDSINIFFDRIFPAIIVLYTILFPLIPSSLTAYTQDQVQAKWRLVVIANQYTFVFLIIGFVWLLYCLGPKLINKRSTCIILGIALIMQFAMTSFTNEKNANTIEVLGTRFEQLDMIIDDVAQTVGQDGIIFTQTLNSDYGILSIPKFYFTSHFNFETGYNITITDKIEDIKTKETVFFLRYIYSENNKVSLFILSKQSLKDIIDYSSQKINSGTEVLQSNEIKVYTFNSYETINIAGRVTGDKESDILVLNEGRETKLSTFDFFQYQINKNLYTAGEPEVLTFRGENISVFSIFALPQYYSTIDKKEKINLSLDKIGSTLSTAEKGQGYRNDGWLDKTAEFNIRTREKGELIITGYYPNEITGDETGTIYIDNKPYSFKISEANFTIKLPAKADKVINVKIDNNFSFQAKPPDVRLLCFILKDLRGE